MLGVLPRGGHAVVTAETTGGQVRMIEAGCEPCHGSMAFFTAIRCLQMPHVLPCGGDSIMAGRAATDHGRVVDSRRSPGHLKMTIFALVGTANMTGPLSGIASDAAPVMAGRTAPGSSLEHSGDVTLLAGNPLMAS